MQHPAPRSPAPPSHGPTSGGSDDYMVGALRVGVDGGRDDPYPAAALLARHWQPVHDYVGLFAPSGSTAGMLTSAAFGQAIDTLRRGEEGGASGGLALRPYFLVEARKVVAAWAGSERVGAILPGIRIPHEPPENRQLIARAFRTLPSPAQVLLWHREVEAEGLSIPAALLAVDPRSAAQQLDDARELLRARCVDAHHDLAPDQECRHFGRLLDLSLRRAGPLIPDIQRHLAQCRFCRQTADQLRQSGGRLPLLLAEAVLGGDATRYLDTRPGRSRPRGGPGGPGIPARGSVEGLRRRAGRHARAVRRRLAPPRRPSGGTLLTCLGAAVTGLLVVAAVAALWPEAEHQDTTARPTPPSTADRTPPAAPPPAHADHPADRDGALRTRFRNATTGRESGADHTGGPTDPVRSTGPTSPQCLDVRDGTPRPGAELTLAACTGSATQTWLYETDGLLRNVAAPGLCPDSRRPDGTVVLAVCGEGPGVRYDVTIQGAVVPRWNDTLALAPVTSAAGTDVVVRLRDGAAPAQRWLTDTPPASAPAPPVSPSASFEEGVSGVVRGPAAARSHGAASYGSPAGTASA